jgi:hypothetical protein
LNLVFDCVEEEWELYFMKDGGGEIGMQVRGLQSWNS